MGDRLTQLQDCLDQLATQFYASIRYVTTHHPSAALPGQPPPRPLSPTLPNSSSNATLPPSTQPTDAAEKNDAPPPASPTHRPLTPPTFSAAVKELAHDLVLKQRQIELIINSLPSIETSEVEQLARIEELDGQLRVMEREREGVVAMKEELLARVEGVIGRVSVGRG